MKDYDSRTIGNWRITFSDKNYHPFKQKVIENVSFQEATLVARGVLERAGEIFHASIRDDDNDSGGRLAMFEKKVTVTVERTE